MSMAPTRDFAGVAEQGKEAFSSAKEETICQVVFQPIGKRVNVKAGTTLLEAGGAAGLLLSANCGGVGVCGRCRISILQGVMEPPSESELTCLQGYPAELGLRLACKARIVSSVIVHVPPSSISGKQQLQVGATRRQLVCDPLIEKASFTVDSQLDDFRSDFARVAQALSTSFGSRKWKVQPRTAAQLTRMARQHGWKLTAYVRRDEVVGFAKAGSRAIGLAVDVGCTKIAGYLVDLHSGHQLGATGMLNPQTVFGEDVVTRLVYAVKGEKESAQLASVVREAINSLIGQLSDTCKVERHEIVDCCIVGNTAMIHLLLGLPVGQLLHAPFVACIDSGLDLDAKECQLDCAPGAKIHILPSIGGFVGADHVAVIIAHGIDRAKRVTIAIDIGTNTEIAMRTAAGDLVTTSVPSGPTFEGGHISNGMRASSGAIEKVRMKNRRLQFETVDGSRPVGLCGSGVIDLVAELRRMDCIDEQGHLRKSASGVKSGQRGLEFLVVPADESGHGQEIVLTQHDISEMQLAKAAISAGIESLLEMTKTSVDDVKEFVVAGAFGTYINLERAISVGLLPRLPNALYLQIGNAAGAGAKMALVSWKVRKRAQMIASRTQHIELKKYHNFNRLLARATQFPRA